MAIGTRGGNWRIKHTLKKRQNIDDLMPRHFVKNDLAVKVPGGFDGSLKFGENPYQSKKVRASVMIKKESVNHLISKNNGIGEDLSPLAIRLIKTGKNTYIQAGYLSYEVNTLAKRMVIIDFFPKDSLTSAANVTDVANKLRGEGIGRNTLFNLIDQARKSKYEIKEVEIETPRDGLKNLLFTMGFKPVQVRGEMVKFILKIK